MIIENYKSNATLIKIDDRDIEHKEKSEENLNILLSEIINRISEYEERK